VAPAKKTGSSAGRDPRPGGENNMPLYRSRKHKIIAGVCGGIAEWLGWDPTAVRIAYVIISIASIGFPGTIAYFILWMVMPKDPVPV
jgi:phage shock protein C